MAPLPDVIQSASICFCNGVRTFECNGKSFGADLAKLELTISSGGGFFVRVVSLNGKTQEAHYLTIAQRCATKKQSPIAATTELSERLPLPGQE